MQEVVSSAKSVGPDALKPKWDQREAVYQCDKRYAGQRLYDNVEPYPYDVLGPVCRAVRDGIMGSLTASPTYCQAVPLGKTTQEAADVIEDGTQAILDSARFERKLDLAILNSVVIGLGFLRIRMDAKGLQIDRIHPGDMIVAAGKGDTTEECGMIGHRFYTPYWEFCQLHEEGAFPMLAKDADLLKYIGESAGDDLTGFDTARNPGTDTPSTSDRRFNEVRLYEAICRIEVEESKKKPKADDEDESYIEDLDDSEDEQYEGDPSETGLYRVVYSDEACEVLLCEPYVYPRPWYFDLRLHDEETYFPIESIASRIMPQCIHISQMMNAAVLGAMAGLTPVTVISGPLLGKKITSLRMGQVLMGGAETKISSFPLEFDITGLLAMIEHSVNFVNKSAGVSESNLQGDETTGGEPKTATEVAQAAEGAQKREGAKARFMGDFIEEVFAFVANLCRWHPDVVKSVYGETVDERFQAALRAKVSWRTTSRSPGATGPMLVAKVQQILAMTEDPSSPFHRGRSQEALGNALQIVDIKSLKKTEDELQQEQAARAEAEQMAKMAAMGQIAAKQGGGGDPSAMGSPGKNGQAFGGVPAGGSQGLL